jgi:hypothetical protein
VEEATAVGVQEEAAHAVARAEELVEDAAADATAREEMAMDRTR